MFHTDNHTHALSLTYGKSSQQPHCHNNYPSCSCSGQIHIPPAQPGNQCLHTAPLCQNEGYSRWRSASPYSLIQCFDNKPRCQSVTHGPSNYLSGIEIQDYCQVQPAFQCRNIRNIRDPYRIGLLCHKVLIQEILSNRQIVL